MTASATMSIATVVNVYLNLAAAVAAVPPDCPNYASYAAERHAPFSSGVRELPFQRPRQDCRTTRVPEVDRIIQEDARNAISDPDLFWLFENTWPNTLDTTVLWQGVSDNNPEEELAFIITGDINAMWIRDSANQLQSYKAALRRSEELKRLFRGAINLQGRYLRQNPYCNAFQAPPESKVRPAKRSIHARQKPFVSPSYDPNVVWDCQYELDSLAAFFQLSWDYYEETNDLQFFKKFSWAETSRKILEVVKALMHGTYTEDGRVVKSPYSWQDHVANEGEGQPAKGGIGLIRSFFRPSDDLCIYPYLIPANMMFSRYVRACAEIMKNIDEGAASDMEKIADGIVKGINDYAIVNHDEFGDIYAYEIDGFGSHALMDDANLPSLLSIPHIGYEPASSIIYQNTREFILSSYNPYYAYGPVLNGTGGPHIGPGRAWPLAVITQALTSEDDEEIIRSLKQLLDSTSDLGLMHESVDSHDDTRWTRPWFAWANGLLGQLIMNLKARKPSLLTTVYQS